MNGHGAKADMEDAEGESTSKTARSDTDDPFYLPHCESDVTLVVEDKKLHVHKAVLSLHSPVFGAMFTADFAEKNAKEIELPGKTYDAMLQFLLQMYPVHSFKPITGMYDAVLALYYKRTFFWFYLSQHIFFFFFLFCIFVCKCALVLKTTFQKRQIERDTPALTACFVLSN